MFFKGKYYFLSNMYPCEITHQGFKFKSSEALYQAYKCKNIEDVKKFVPLDGYDSKRLGRVVELRENWDDAKVEIMYNIVKAKFSQNKSLANKLISLNEEIVEDNWHRDTFWGKVDGKGENMLGKILMLVRKELKKNN